MRSERSLPMHSGSGRQRMNMMRATADAAFDSDDSTFSATLVTAGTHRNKIGDTVTVKNYGGGGNEDQEILIWSYDDGTFELIVGSPSFDIAKLQYNGNSYATTTWTRQEIAVTSVSNAITPNTVSEVYGNRIIGATLGNIVIQKPGTYQLYFPLSVINERRQSQTSYTFFDQASMANTFWQEHFGNEETIELRMYVTAENNTTAPTGLTGRVAYTNVSAQDSGLFRSGIAPHQFEIPAPLGCVFSVADANTPFELQLWTKSNTAASASQNTVRQLNEGYIIRYPYALALQTTPYSAVVPPP